LEILPAGMAMFTIVEKSKRPTNIGTDGVKVTMDIANGMTMKNLEIGDLDNGRRTNALNAPCS